MFKALQLFFEDMSLISIVNSYVNAGLISARTAKYLLKAYEVKID